MVHTIHSVVVVIIIVVVVVVSEKLKDEKTTSERMYHSLVEQHQSLLQRARDSEILVINTRREHIIKPASGKLQEIEKLWCVLS